ncbi:NAD(P)H-dependent oxidoreductase [Halosquirtibacter laminarini]|uniref:NAD(P)H-dependent oxidoreductase n=1 Tax=Halosquirtibacter laminarini TaxID=3374600 RepID=A0AC61NNV5_9BACT|nr:NAD(P)H-dependent oxidoreductase [Prolixibacteraceae bacterium]
MSLIEDLEWRYATKSFNTTKSVSKDDLDKLIHAVQLTPTSLGLQTFHLHVIESHELKQELFLASFNQQQVVQASHVMVISYYPQVVEKQVDEIIAIKSKLENIPVSTLVPFKEFVMGYINRMEPQDMDIWSAKQTYIAMGVLLSACAELHIDACPMEGFDKNAYDNILNLTEKGLKSSLVIPIGYRDSEDKYQFMKKVRRDISDLTTFL